uniref:SGNH hydrolase-type esterase domain-containing protein n=1 Tax=Strigops habroptila TaxID=2489341 RepID=A0A672URF4_STRHB
MVSTRLRSRARSGSSAPAVASVGTQTEPMRGEAAAQTSECRKCLDWSREAGVRDGQGCTRCALVEVLLQQVAELREAVGELKDAREAERKLGCLLQAQTAQGLQTSSIARIGKKEGSNPGSWELVTGKTNKKRRKRTINDKELPPKSDVPTQNRFAVLQEANEKAPTTPNEHPADAPVKRITTGASRKKRRVIVVGDSTLKGTEALICRPDPVSREVCCLPGAQIRDVTERLPALVSPADYYPLLVVHVGARDIDSSCLEDIKKDYRALGEVVKGSGAQIVFSSILQGKGEDLKKARRVWQVNKWLESWCHSQGFGYLEHGAPFGRPDLLEAGGAGLTKKGKSCFGRRLARLVRKALN